MFAPLTLRNTPPCPLRSHRGSVTQTPKKAFYHFRSAPMICIFLGVFAPQWRSVPLRSTQRRRRKNEKKRRGKGIRVGGVPLVASPRWWQQRLRLNNLDLWLMPAIKGFRAAVICHLSGWLPPPECLKILVLWPWPASVAGQLPMVGSLAPCRRPRVPRSLVHCLRASVVYLPLFNNSIIMLLLLSFMLIYDVFTISLFF